eukprot:714498_1
MCNSRGHCYSHNNSQIRQSNPFGGNSFTIQTVQFSINYTINSHTLYRNPIKPKWRAIIMVIILQTNATYLHNFCFKKTRKSFQRHTRCTIHRYIQNPATSNVSTCPTQPESQLMPDYQFIQPHYRNISTLKCRCVWLLR